MAEVISRHVASKMGLNSAEFRSAGTLTHDGLPASGGAVRAARRHGLSLDDHVSTVLCRELVDWADWIFAMGPGHLHHLRLLGGDQRAVLLGAFAGGDTVEGEGIDEAGLAVPDPFGGDDMVYEETFKTLEEYVVSAMKRLMSEVG